MDYKKPMGHTIWRRPMRFRTMQDMKSINKKFIFKYS